MTARLIQVTLGAAATQVISTPTYFNQMTVQNNSAAVARLGDSTVSSTKGISLAATGGSWNSGPIAGQQGDASQFWLLGTAADVIDILLV